MGATLLAVAIFALLALQAYMGIHVALHPPDSDKAKRWWKIGFIAITVIAVPLLVIQTRKAAEDAATVQSQLSEIRVNTSKPPKIDVHVPPATPPQIVINPAPPSPPRRGGFMQVSNIVVHPMEVKPGAVLRVNVYLQNMGSEPVDDFTWYCELLFVAAAERDVHRSFLQRVKELHRNAQKKSVMSQAVGVAHEAWDTLQLPLSDAHVESFLRGTSRVYVAVWATWRGAERDLDQCLWLQAPSSPRLDNNNLVWHVCEG